MNQVRRQDRPAAARESAARCGNPPVIRPAIVLVLRDVGEARADLAAELEAALRHRLRNATKRTIATVSTASRRMRLIVVSARGAVW